MIDLKRHKQSEQEFWQNQMTDTSESPIDPAAILQVTGGIKVPTILSPLDTNNLIQPSDIIEDIGSAGGR